MAAEGGVMNHDDLDHLLSHEAEIVPSSGFTASVLNLVRAQAQAPPPIPFPWKRALPGMAAAVLSLAWIVFACVAVFSSSGDGEVLVLSVPPALQHLWHAASWVLIALVTTVVSLLFSWRFVSRIP
jgi:hypothetical protein